MRKNAQVQLISMSHSSRKVIQTRPANYAIAANKRETSQMIISESRVAM